MIIRGKIADYEERQNEKGKYYRVTVEPDTPVVLSGFVAREPAIGSMCLCSIKNGRIEDITFIGKEDD